MRALIRVFVMSDRCYVIILFPIIELDIPGRDEFLQCPASSEPLALRDVVVDAIFVNRGGRIRKEYEAYS